MHHKKDRNGDGKGTVKEHVEASKRDDSSSGDGSSKGVSKQGVKGYHGKEQTNGDIKQMLKTCTTQIKQLGKTRQWRQALQVLRAIQQHDIVPNVITYSA